MAEYRATVLVTYTVVADSAEEARELLSDTGAMEHPLFPYGSGWCEGDEIQTIVLKED